MRFHLSFTSGKPVYLQIVDQVRAAAASGALQAGDPLPAIRPLAEELRVNRNTVAKAYAELEAQGVIETAAGRGCFLRPVDTALRKDARRRMLAEVLDEAAVRAHHLQFDRAEFLSIAGHRYDALEERRTHAAGGRRS